MRHWLARTSSISLKLSSLAIALSVLGTGCVGSEDTGEIAVEDPSLLDSTTEPLIVNGGWTSGGGLEHSSCSLPSNYCRWTCTPPEHDDDVYHCRYVCGCG